MRRPANGRLDPAQILPSFSWQTQAKEPFQVHFSRGAEVAPLRFTEIYYGKNGSGERT